MIFSQAVKCAIGGSYTFQDGRSFWIDGPVAREITRRVLASAAMIEQQNLLRECLVTLRHAEVFISSREKMHPDGQALYRELLEKLEAQT